MVRTGMSVVRRKNVGCFPLRGKVLNVVGASSRQIAGNAEVQNILKIVGLSFSGKYETEADPATLRYGRIAILADQDSDGTLQQSGCASLIVSVDAVSCFCRVSHCGVAVVLRTPFVACPRCERIPLSIRNAPCESNAQAFQDGAFLLRYARVRNMGTFKRRRTTYHQILQGLCRMRAERSALFFLPR